MICIVKSDFTKTSSFAAHPCVQWYGSFLQMQFVSLQGCCFSAGEQQMSKFSMQQGRESHTAFLVIRYISLDLCSSRKDYPIPLCFWLEMWWLSNIDLYACSAPFCMMQQETRTETSKERRCSSGEGHGTSMTYLVRSRHWLESRTCQLIYSFVYLFISVQKTEYLLCAV